MTTTQARSKLKAAGILTDKNKDRIVIRRGVEIEVNPHKNGGNALASRVARCLGLGGYKTGYGSWIYREGYRSLGDWNDRTSLHHR